MLRVFNKNHGLNYFSLGYEKGNAYGKNYSMNMHYPSQGMPKIHWARKHIFWRVEGYCIALPKPPRKPIQSLRYSIIKHHGFTLFEGYCSCPKLHNTLTIPLINYPRNTMGSITYLFKLGGVLHSHTKTKKENNTCIILQ
jgi:hypothetical protein